MADLLGRIRAKSQLTRKSHMCILLPIERPAGKFEHTNADASRTILFASV